MPGRGPKGPSLRGRTPSGPKDRALATQASDRSIKLEGDGAGHGDYAIADRAIRFLQENRDRPFFLACGFNKPHSPPTAPARFFALYDPAAISLPASFAPRPTLPEGFPKSSLTPNGDLFIKRDATPDEARQMTQAYWASISWVDWNIGRVIDTLDRLGLREKTVIVFWGDHGYHLGEFGKWSKHGSLFEVGTRVPLIVVAPGMKVKGSVVRPPVQTLDLYPTLCDLCGVPTPAGLEGHSLKPLLDDPDTRWDHPVYSVAGNRKNLGVSVRTERFRYAEWNDGQNGAMLFDEAADPDERVNLVSDPRFAQVRDELAALARKHAAARSASGSR